MRNVPTAAWVSITAAFLGTLTALVVMSVMEVDTTELTRFLNIVMNAALLLVGGAGTLYSGAAARSAQDAAEQTNGTLDARIAAGVSKALEAQRAADTSPGGEFRRE